MTRTFRFSDQVLYIPTNLVDDPVSATDDRIDSTVSIDLHQHINTDSPLLILFFRNSIITIIEGNLAPITAQEIIAYGHHRTMMKSKTDFFPYKRVYK